MERQDFWYHPDARKAGAIPTGSRAGQFLFLSAQTPVDLETGALVRNLWELRTKDQESIAWGMEFPDAHQGPIKAQTWVLYQNLAKLLAQQGSSLDNIVRQRIYLRDLSDIAAMEKTMLSFFPGDKPATMILGVPDQGMADGILIQVEVIALVTQAGGLRRESISIPELASVTGPYPQAVKVGQFLFFSGFMGIDPASGRLVTRLTDLGPDAEQIREGCPYSDARAEALKAQIWLTFKHMERVVQSLGGSGLKDVLRVNMFTRHAMKEVADVYEVRMKLLGKREEAPAMTGFAIENLCPIEEAVFISDAVALLPGEYRKELDVVPDRTVGPMPMWTKAGPFWFVSGDLGLNTPRHQPIRSFSDLPDAGRFLAQGSLHNVQTTMAQAWYIYQSLDRMMRSAGSELSKVVQQTIYMRNLSEYPAVERVASIVYEGRLPPTTVMPVDDIGPYKELALEIETISLVE